MPLENLNHFLILAKDLEATRDFYVEVLGLRVGERPPFPFPGYWIYLGDQAVVHLAKLQAEAEQRDYLGERGPSADTGALDHIAFEASGLKQMIAELEERGIAARHRRVPDAGLYQLFIQDPNGLTIELNYPAAEGREIPIQ